jgi:hypothetical protein
MITVGMALSEPSMSQESRLVDEMLEEDKIIGGSISDMHQSVHIAVI